jgi:soluble lytic murein transglycosylase-like protein
MRYQFTRLFYLFILALSLCPVNASNNQQVKFLIPDIATLYSTQIINPVKPYLVFSDKAKADAWLNDMSNRLKKWIPDEFTRKHYLTIIQYEATRAGLDPQLVLALITVESKFNKYAISPSGARGLMQIMPFWQNLIGEPGQDLFDVQTNLRYGCTILRFYLDQQNWNFTKALAAYNGSNNQTWYPELILNSYNNYWQPSEVAQLKNGKLQVINYDEN